MTSPTLRDLEGAFWRSLHAGVADAGLTDVVEPTPTLTPEGRVRIYQDMYFWRLHGVLLEDFSATASLLGSSFEGVAREYVRTHPSAHPSVRHVGRHLADFLAARNDPEHPWIADLARLEWAKIEVFDAVDEPTLELADLQSFTPEAFPGLVFQPVAGLQVLRSAWPVHRATTPEEHVHLDPEPTALRVWRKGGLVYHGVMDAFEDAGLERLMAGDSFASICEVLAEVAPERVAEESGALLVRWLEDGLITRATLLGRA